MSNTSAELVTASFPPPISITLPPKYLSKKSFDLTCAVFVDSLIVGIVCKMFILRLIIPNILIYT